MDTKKVVISEEELKEVTGGANNVILNTNCSNYMTEVECVQISGCEWIDNKRCASNGKSIL